MILADNLISSPMGQGFGPNMGSYGVILNQSESSIWSRDLNLAPLDPPPMTI